MAAFDFKHATEAFFVEFDEAFTSFDGVVVAARYAAPYLAVRKDGSSDRFTSADAVANYFQRILDEYRRKGCRSCRHRDLDVAAVGKAVVFVTVTWDLLRRDDSVLSSWRESYTLVRSRNELKACVSIDHAQ